MACDPIAAFVGELNGESFVAAGCYIMRKEYRGKGYGKKTFDAPVTTVKPSRSIGIISDLSVPTLWISESVLWSILRTMKFLPSFSSLATQTLHLKSKLGSPVVYPPAKERELTKRLDMVALIGDTTSIFNSIVSKTYYAMSRGQIYTISLPEHSIIAI